MHTVMSHKFDLILFRSWNWYSIRC